MEGGTPFRLRATVSLFGINGKHLDGTYLLEWQSPQRWREDAEFPGYSQVLLQVADKLWRRRSAPQLPLRVFELRQAMDFASALTIRPEQTAKNVKERKKSGTPVKCFDLIEELMGSATVCFDVNAGTLATRGNKSRESNYSAYEPWGKKLVPRAITVLDHGAPAVQVRVLELSEAVLPADLFRPPDNAEERPGCQTPDQPRLLNKLNPRYPDEAKLGRISGIVSVIAEIGTDGAVHEAYVAASPSKIFNPDVLRAIRQWKYQPATCQSSPVPTEIEIDINFELRE